MNDRDSVLSWCVEDRGFTPELTRAARGVLEHRLGGPDRVGLAYLGGSFAVGLGHGTSDVDLYVVGSGLPTGDLVVVHDGLEVHVNPMPADTVRDLIAVGTDYRATARDRAQIRIGVHTLNSLVRLATGIVVHTGAQWRELLDTFDTNVVRQILMTRNAHIFATYAEDVSGALDAGDLFTAATASGLGLQAACDAALAAAGDIYPGPKFLFRRLARNAVTAPWCDHLWRLLHRDLHPERGRWPGEVRTVAEDRLWAGGLLLASCAVEGWDEPLDRFPPVPARPDGSGPRRNRYHAPLRFADGWALIGPGNAYEVHEVTEHTLRLWRRLDGRPLSAVAREDPDAAGDVDAAVAWLAGLGAVDGHPADGPEPPRSGEAAS